MKGSLTKAFEDIFLVPFLIILGVTIALGIVIGAVVVYVVK